MMIQTQALIKRYNGQKQNALKNLAFSVPQSSLYGLVGPDGAGKTTLLRILAGVLPPTSGSVSIAGFKVGKEAARIRLDGLHASGIQPISGPKPGRKPGLFAQISTYQGKGLAASALLEFTQLAPFAKRRAGKLSAG